MLSVGESNFHLPTTLLKSGMAINQLLDVLIRIHKERLKFARKVIHEMNRSNHRHHEELHTESTMDS
jgi:hypothetical protein